MAKGPSVTPGLFYDDPTLLRLWGQCWTERLDRAKACPERGRRGR